MECCHTQCLYSKPQDCPDCGQWWCGIGCEFCTQGQSHTCRICRNVHRTKDHALIYNNFPYNETQLLQLLDCSYNFYSGMNVLNLRDRAIPEKENYSWEEYADMFLAGMAIQSFGVVLHVDNHGHITWRKESQIPQDMISDTMKKNIQLLIRLSHPAFISLR